MPERPSKPRVVIVGAGFAGYEAARRLSRLAGDRAEIVVVSSADYFLYLPLMPQVTGGLVEPRHICVSLLSRLRGVRFILGEVTHVDRQAKTSARPSTCAITSPVSWSWRPRIPTLPSGPPAAPSWWSGPAAPAPRSPPRGSCSPAGWPGSCPDWPARRTGGGRLGTERGHARPGGVVRADQRAQSVPLDPDHPRT